MRILILGASGMVGHKAYQVLSKDFDTYAAFRKFDNYLRNTKIFEENKVCDHVDAFDFDKVVNAIDKVNPRVVLNCIGIIKQSKDVQDAKAMTYINSLFPHLLEEYCENAGIKMIHVSTDCVFSGRKGNYVEEDLSDAQDSYGKTKFEGEVKFSEALTLRTSIIGRELFSDISLVDWFLSQEGKTVKGYEKAIYTGFTSVVFCNEISRIIKSFFDLKGLYHVSSDPISKYDLLKIIKEIYSLNIEIQRDSSFVCDRSLNSEKYRKATSFFPIGWKEMVKAMRDDEFQYAYRRKT